jgi:Ran GTPase-activating protein (RanGAP) involved in mRNA processing and transport
MGGGSSVPIVEIRLPHDKQEHTSDDIADGTVKDVSFETKDGYAGLQPSEFQELAFCLFSKHNKLGKLNLSGNKLDCNDLITLAGVLGQCKQLERLTLSNNHIGDRGVVALASACRSCNHITELFLSNNRIGSRGCIWLADSLMPIRNKTVRMSGWTPSYGLISRKMPSIRIMHMDGNPKVHLSGWQAMGRMVTQNTSLLQLNVSGEVLYLHELRGAQREILEIELAGRKLRDADGCVVAGMLGANVSLQALDLSQNAIGDGGGICIANSLATNMRLVSLDLSENLLGKSTMTALVAALAGQDSLQHLYLHGNPLTFAAGEMLAHALEKNRRLDTLSLSGEFLHLGDLRGDEGCRKHLDYTAKGLNDADCAVIAKLLPRNKRMLSLNLNDNSFISKHGVRAIAKALKDGNHTLEVLKLNKARVDDGGASALGQMLYNNTGLKTLSLNEAQVGDAGGVALGDGLKENRTLEELLLNTNTIGALGAIEIFEGVEYNDSLVELDLSHNEIGEGASKAMGRAICANTSLCSLGLDNNGIGPRTVACLADGLTMNESLTNMGIRQNALGEKGAEVLAASLEENSHLAHLQVTMCRLGMASKVELYTHAKPTLHLDVADSFDQPIEAFGGKIPEATIEIKKRQLKKNERLRLVQFPVKTTIAEKEALLDMIEEKTGYNYRPEKEDKYKYA